MNTDSLMIVAALCGFAAGIASFAAARYARGLYLNARYTARIRTLAEEQIAVADNRWIYVGELKIDTESGQGAFYLDDEFREEADIVQADALADWLDAMSDEYNEVVARLSASLDDHGVSDLTMH